LETLVFCDEIPSEYRYLADEGVKGGWEDPTDQAMTALFALKHKYLLDPNHWSSGGGQRHFRGQRGGPFERDAGIEGTNGGHMLLAKVIGRSHVAGVRRLMKLGVATHVGHEGWFWDSFREFERETMRVEAEAAARPANANAEHNTNDDEELHEVIDLDSEDDMYDSDTDIDESLRARRLVYDYFGKEYAGAGRHRRPSKLTSTQPLSRRWVINALCSAHDSINPYESYTVGGAVDYSDGLASTITTMAMRGSEEATIREVLQLLLEWAEESGFLATSAGRESLETCQKVGSPVILLSSRSMGLTF
jgi:hypothetical protein